MSDLRRRYRRAAWLWTSLAALGLAGAAFAASPIDGYGFADAATAGRYQALLAEFRCPKCLNESIASSGAPIAVDLRRTVRRLIESGATDADIRAHLQERYGDFVLYDPPMRPGTWLLWLSPLALVCVGLAVLARVGVQRRAAGLTVAERERLERLVEDARDDAREDGWEDAWEDAGENAGVHPRGDAR